MARRQLAVRCGSATQLKSPSGSKSEEKEKRREAALGIHDDKPRNISGEIIAAFFGSEIEQDSLPPRWDWSAYRERHSFWPAQTAKKTQQNIIGTR